MSKIDTIGNGQRHSKAAARKHPIRVLLAEPHTLVRTGVHSLLNQIPEIRVVGEIGESHLLTASVEQHKPEVILFGVSMSGSDWLDQATHVTKTFPQVKAIMFSTHHGEDYVMHLLRAGVTGILLEDATLKELKMALKSVLADEIYLCRDIDKQAIKNRLKRSKGPAAARSQLTSRQREILELIAEGKTTKEIAFLLKLSTKTIETHRAHMMERLKIYNVPGLVRYAMRVGLTSLES